MSKLLGWHSGCDGPSVLMPIEVVPLWEGTELPSNGRTVEAEFRWSGQTQATDYDRACDASSHSHGELFPFGSAAAYVPDSGQQIAVFESSDPTQQFLLELWASDEDESDDALLQRALQSISEPTSWHILGNMECQSGEIWVFHAADTGTDILEDEGANIETPFSFILNPGTYQLLYADWPNPKWPEGKNGLIWLRKEENS
ncbi:MAG: hypothetical protein QM758_15730 [Armatimonas sp.]